MTCRFTLTTHALGPTARLGDRWNAVGSHEVMAASAARSRAPANERRPSRSRSLNPVLKAAVSRKANSTWVPGMTVRELLQQLPVALALLLGLLVAGRLAGRRRSWSSFVGDDGNYPG